MNRLSNAIMALTMVSVLLVAVFADAGASLSGTVVTGNQLLVAVAESQDTSLAKVYAFSRTASGWKLSKGPFPGIIGRNGFARPGEKREGDGCTPSGLFPLEFAFGYGTKIDSHMPYRQVTENDLWVDDVQSSDYNRLVKRGESTATSFEIMKMPDQRYSYGMVIGYNRNPIVKGAGSAIFAHVWLEEGFISSGCLALEKSGLLDLLAWLDPAERPQILMGLRQDLVSVAGLPPVPKDLEQTGILEQQIRGMVAGTAERIVEYHAADGFFGMAVPVPNTVAGQMLLKKSWKDGCPVPISDLSYLVLTHWGFDDRPKVGELVVHKKLALPVIKAFGELFTVRFPIEKMELIERYDASDDRSMEANNSSAFNCRDITGKPGTWSKHSYGGAIDINPLQNPYISPKADPLKILGWNGHEDKGDFLRRSGYDAPSPALEFCTRRPSDCLVLPPASGSYRDRKQDKPGLLLAGTRPVTAFTRRGFDWGGSWQRLLDYQHFEYATEKLLQK